MIDLNTPSAEDFDRIAALRGYVFEIVCYREQRGGFTSLRQLNEAPGLTGKTDDVDDQVGVEALVFVEKAMMASHVSRRT